MFKDFNMHVSGTDSCSLQGEEWGCMRDPPPPVRSKNKTYFVYGVPKIYISPWIHSYRR